MSEPERDDDLVYDSWPDLDPISFVSERRGLGLVLAALSVLVIVIVCVGAL
ncbi:hypothetical protein [Kineosporia succinea]|uniref:Uncharacterized protein n=1 Tax=Kineosporia succinea TaxID=84632 RepID=A0ABT9PAA4_9ACTN|nr:hypothetical protein [Kineosporia succinea]MDP9829427.1 hypothetical protein [Kineosporia succinea]